MLVLLMQTATVRHDIDHLAYEHSQGCLAFVSAAHSVPLGQSDLEFHAPEFADVRLVFQVDEFVTQSTSILKARDPPIT